jgi:hypothetical protein
MEWIYVPTSSMNLQDGYAPCDHCGWDMENEVYVETIASQVNRLEEDLKGLINIRVGEFESKSGLKVSSIAIVSNRLLYNEVEEWDIEKVVCQVHGVRR